MVVILAMSRGPPNPAGSRWQIKRSLPLAYYRHIFFLSSEASPRITCATRLPGFQWHFAADEIGRKVTNHSGSTDPFRL